MEISARDIQARFQELFRKEPLIIRAPGRINLIGEHTDYNDGFVMPAAVDKEIFFGIAASNDSRSVVYSLKYDERFEINLEDPRPIAEPRWANYLLGVLYQFKEHGYPVKPFSCVFGGNIPLGAGMSSSAALECGFATALSEYHLLNVPKLDIVTMSQWAEHHYVGVKCGIMDQFASVMSKAGHVIVLDCREMTHHYAPLDLKDYSIVLCDTKVKHSLVDSEYNRRRAECESGVRILQKYHPFVKSLRDVSMEMLTGHQDELQGKIYQRCRYVVAEIERVQVASEDLKRGDLVAFGKKMYETHEGLSKDYEVSCAELDFLVDQAKTSGYVIGARMMGGGFGGCTINLVKSEASKNFIEQMRVLYKTKFNIDMPAYRVKVVDGTGKVKDSDLVLWS